MKKKKKKKRTKILCSRPSPRGSVSKDMSGELPCMAFSFHHSIKNLDIITPLNWALLGLSMVPCSTCSFCSLRCPTFHCHPAAFSLPPSWWILLPIPKLAIGIVLFQRRSRNFSFYGINFDRPASLLCPLYPFLVAFSVYIEVFSHYSSSAAC